MEGLQCLVHTCFLESADHKGAPGWAPRWSVLRLVTSEQLPLQLVETDGSPQLLGSLRAQITPEGTWSIHTPQLTGPFQGNEILTKQDLLLHALGNPLAGVSISDYFNDSLDSP